MNVPEQQEEFIPVVDIPQREELVTDISQPTKSQTNPPLSLKRVELPKDKSAKEIIEEVYNTQLPKLPEESIETIRIKDPDDKGLLYKLTEPFNRSQYQSAEALKDAITLALNGVGRY